MGAVHKALLKQIANLEKKLNDALCREADLLRERDALNSYVSRVSETARTLQKRLRDAGLSDGPYPYRKDKKPASTVLRV